VTGVAVTRTVRLALGLEVVDAVRGDPADVEVRWENVPRPVPPATTADWPSPYDVGLDLPRLSRGLRPGRFRIAYTPEDRPPRVPVPPARLRICDPHRRYVPRRLQVPFPNLAAVLSEEQASGRPAWRGRTVRVFPGAAFRCEGASTGIRGRAVDAAGVPLRWVRALATHPARGTVLGYAHGDDRGEFLLLLSTPPSTLEDPGGLTFTVDVTVAARPPGAPMPSPLTQPPEADPLGDLVRELLPAPGLPDAVSSGATTPAGFTRTVTTAVTVTLGRLVSPPVPFVPV
jgi:hypothetical protein